jgi:hypothetical protein
VGKRYESVDASGMHAYQQDGMEVHETGGGRYRCCFDPKRLGAESAWVPSTFDTVDEAFKAGRIAKSVARMMAG